MQRERNIMLEDFPSVTVRITDEIYTGSCAPVYLRSGLTSICSTSSVLAVDGQLTHKQNSGGNTASGTSVKENYTEDNRHCVVATQKEVGARFTTGNIGVTRRLIGGLQVRVQAPITEKPDVQPERVMSQNLWAGKPLTLAQRWK